MSRFFNVAVVLLALISGAALYQINHKVQQRLERLENLEARIEREADAIRVLRAEWAYLTDPARLQAESAAHLDLGPSLPDQVATTFAAVPFRGSDYALARADAHSLMPRPRPRHRQSVPVSGRSAALAADLGQTDSIDPVTKRGPDRFEPASRQSKADFTRRVSRVLEELQGGER